MRRGKKTDIVRFISLLVILLIFIGSIGIVIAAESADNQEEKESFIYAQKSIKQKAIDVGKQIEIYIHANPDKTIWDLQNDSYFQEIAVQQVGKTGYTAVHEHDTLINRFHSNPKIVDMDLHNLKEKLPAFWEVLSGNEGGVDADGTYDWEEADGSIEKKYMYIAVVNAKTADSIGLSVAATTYLDEYEDVSIMAPEIEEREEKTSPLTLTYWLVGALIILFIVLFFLQKFHIIKIERTATLILLGFVLLAIIGLFVFNTYLTTQGMREEKAHATGDTLTAVALLKAYHIETFLDEQKEIVRLLSVGFWPEQLLKSSEQDAGYASLYVQIKQTLSNSISGDLYEIFILDKTGKVVMSTEEKYVGMNQSDNAYFVNAKEDSHIKDIYLSATTGKKSLAVSQPINDHETNEFLGVIVGRIEIKEMENILTDTTGLGKTGEVYLINSEGYMLTPSRFKEDTFLKQKIDTANSRYCFEGKDGPRKHTGHEAVNIFKNYRNVSVLGTHAYLPKIGWCLLAEIEEQEVFEETIKTTQNIWLFTFGSIITIIAVGIVFNFLLTRSLRKEIEDRTKELHSLNRRLETLVKKRTEELEKKSKALKKLNITLEHQVEKRTEEIHEKMKELEESRTATLNILEDVDEGNKKLMEANTKLEEYVKQLKELDKKKDEFVSVTAHELKTPLTSIRGFITLLENPKVFNNKEQRNRFFQIIKDDTIRLAALITDILDLSRMDMGTLKFDFEIIEPKDIIKPLKAEMHPIIKNKGLKEVYQVEKNLPAIRVDVKRLMQVLGNLVRNGVHYTDKGSITIKVFKKGGFIHFAIIDTGLGIPKVHQKKIFERFYQIDSSYTRKIGGSGLGLAISQGIIEAFGGKIWVESTFGKGSNFEFTIPITKRTHGGVEEEYIDIFKSLEKEGKVDENVKEELINLGIINQVGEIVKDKMKNTQQLMEMISKSGYELQVMPEKLLEAGLITKAGKLKKGVTLKELEVGGFVKYVLKKS